MFIYFVIITIFLSYAVEINTVISPDTKAIVNAIIIVTILIIYYLDDIASKLGDKSKKSDDGTT